MEAKYAPHFVLMLALFSLATCETCETRDRPLTTEDCCNINVTDESGNTAVCIHSCPLKHNTTYCKQEERYNGTLDLKCSLFNQTENITDCVVCHPQCIGCTGPNNTNCLRCVNFRHKNICLEKCPNGTMENSTRKFCLDVNNPHTSTLRSTTAQVAEKRLPIGLIVGLCVGLAIVFTIVLIVVLCVHRRRWILKDRDNRSQPPSVDVIDAIVSFQSDKFAEEDNPAYENVLHMTRLPSSIREAHDNIFRYTPDPTAVFNALEQKGHQSCRTNNDLKSWPLKSTNHQKTTTTNMTNTTPEHRETWLVHHEQQIYENTQLDKLNAVTNDTGYEQEMYENCQIHSNDQEIYENYTKNTLENEPDTRIDDLRDLTSSNVRDSDHIEPDSLPIAPLSAYGESYEIYGNMETITSYPRHNEIYENCTTLYGEDRCK